MTLKSMTNGTDGLYQSAASCHCGAVRYESDIDLSVGTGKCNCAFCTKIGNWSAIIKSADFRLLSGENDLSFYQFGTKSGDHLFCKHRCVRPFGRDYIGEIGGDYVGMQFGTLDDVELAELVQTPVKYGNGRDNSWWTEPAETWHL